MTEIQEQGSKRTPDWSRLMGLLKPYYGQAILAIVAILAATGVGLSFPLVIAQILDSVTNTPNVGSLNHQVVILACIVLAQAAFSFAQSYLLIRIGEHIVFDLRTTLYMKLQFLSLDFFSGRRVGELISRISNDVTQVRTILTTSLAASLSQLTTLIGALVIVYLTNRRLMLFIVCVSAFVALIAKVFGGRIQKSSTKIQDSLADSTVVAEEGLQSVRIVKGFGREEYEVRRFASASYATFRASMHLALFNSSFSALMVSLGIAWIGAVAWYGGHEVIAGRLSLAMITGFLMYGGMIAGSMAGLATLYGQFQAAIGAMPRVFQLLDLSPSVRDLDGAHALLTTKGKITFEGASFSYVDGSPVLHEIRLNIEAGEILALVGPSGSGKSTLMNLIPRFYDPTDGSIKIDGVDLRNVTQASLRTQIAMVPQETILFGGTIRDNILYGRLEATDAQLESAARAANAHEFIMSLVSKYDTVVGERANKLSGGQRQRIAMARAILKDPRILLLDEATSSLDSESEELVQDGLNRLMQGRTTVVIAHRLSTIKAAHRIAVLERGRIIELGSHDELMRAEGLYARLYIAQFRDPADGRSKELK